MDNPTRPTVVFLHGFGEDNRIWTAQVNWLKKDHPVLAPDLPGSGQNPALLPGTPSIEAMADYVKNLLDEQGITKAILIGHSMGGYIALAFAAKYPEQLSAIGLFHSTTYADNEEKIAARRKGINFIRKNGAAAFLRQSIPNLFADTSRTQHPEWVNHLIEKYAGFNPDSLVYYYEAMIHRPDRSALLQAFDKPVLFLIGEQDKTVPLNDSLQQAHMPSTAFIHILAGTGHLGMLEEEERSNKILKDFLDFVSH